jgi:replicative DNA helicase
MSKVSDRIEDLKRIKAIRDKGELLCIPYYKSYPKLSKFVPGIVKSIMYKITAGSGVGKTQLTKALFVLAPLNYIKQNPKTKIKIKIFYFALEESEEEFIDNLICNQLAFKHNIRMDVMTLKGYREKYLDDELIKKIVECQEDCEFFMEHIEVIDSVSNPTGMYKYCRTYSEKVGTHYWNEVEFTKTNKEGEQIITKEKIYDRYEPKDPNEHVIVITDHFSLITPEYDTKLEKRLNRHESMAKWSTHYCRGQLTKHWGWTCVGVQQQEQSGEKQHYTNSGESVISKTEPTLDGLANNKEIQRDDYVVLALYSPDRFGFEEYHGYDINRMRDTFRVIIIRKNRLGVPNKYVPLLFDGSTNQFAELPFSEETEKLKKYYEKSDKLIG